MQALKSINWYNVFIGLRLLAVFISFGYLHPDGFFQSPEVVASDVLGLDTNKPWEFQTGHLNSPCRTIVTPALASGIPLFLVKVLSSLSPKFLSAYFLLWIPRLFLFLSSFLIDYTVWKLSSGKQGALLAAASSWTTLTFILSPFSNTVESLLLCVLLLSTFRKDPNHTLIGLIISVGVFNRFSFFFYALPVCAYLIYNVLNDKVQTGKVLSGLTFGFFTTSLVITLIDSVYFGVATVTLGGTKFEFIQLLNPSFYLSALTSIISGAFKIEGSFVITPLNNLRYNLNPASSELHGVHPRWYHFALNMPYLFGPLYISAVVPLSNMLDDFIADKTGINLDKGKKRLTKKTAAKQRGPLKTKLEKEIYWVLVACLVCNVGFLSIATHQEARFLLPNLICLCVIAGAEMLDADSPWWVKGSWFAHGLTLFLILGFAHQGGVIRAVANFQTESISSPGATHLVFYKTYTPPQYLLAQKRSEPAKVSVYSAPANKEWSVSEVRKVMIKISEAPSFNATTDQIFLITPATIDVQEIGSNLVVKKSYWPHLSIEDPPETVSSYFTQTKLNVFHRQ